ncbi:uncharacterized protein LOC111194535 [Astyanax mexicanus]|uniref:uncharacterized protein LOC111194535 n=1 Tax=Astyanax mexicanus TaxID=7994 RepID=UPI0020CAF2C1|nr:uncharacterized protein LOC111194535 [Astyanax mexicanus]
MANFTSDLFVLCGRFTSGFSRSSPRVPEVKREGTSLFSDAAEHTKQGSTLKCCVSRNCTNPVIFLQTSVCALWGGRYISQGSSDLQHISQRASVRCGGRWAAVERSGGFMALCGKDLAAPPQHTHNTSHQLLAASRQH